MVTNKKYNVITAVFLLCAVAGFGFYYFQLMKSEINGFIERDRQVLTAYNAEITKKLQAQPDTDGWQEIIDDYKSIIVHIEDSEGNTLVQTTGREWKAINSKVQNAFMYNGKAYLIRTSVYLMRSRLTDTRFTLRLILIAFSVVLLAAFLLLAIIYLTTLKPIYRLYDNIEKYEHGEKIERSRSRSQISRLQNRFVDLTETISKQQDGQRTIIASISHDIKTPLTSIMGYTEMLKKENLSEERKEKYLNTVYQKAESIRDLIDEFDEFLSYNSDAPLKVKPYTVADFLKKITDGYPEELESLGIEFIAEIPDGEDVIEADIQKMRRVIGNLISNSIKHFKSDKRIIRITSRAEGDNVLIILEDNGEGVPEDKTEVIFEPLYTSDQGRKVAGLGLAICREIADAHGGKITAGKSSLGGLAVTITLKKAGRKNGNKKE